MSRPSDASNIVGGVFLPLVVLTGWDGPYAAAPGFGQYMYVIAPGPPRSKA